MIIRLVRVAVSFQLDHMRRTSTGPLLLQDLWRRRCCTQIIGVAAANECMQAAVAPRRQMILLLLLLQKITVWR
jgi:hypothetical protein